MGGIVTTPHAPICSKTFSLCSNPNASECFLQTENSWELPGLIHFGAGQSRFVFVSKTTLAWMNFARANSIDLFHKSGVE